MYPWSSVTVAFIVLGIQSLLAQDLVYKPKKSLLVETLLITNGWLALLSLKINLQIKPSKKITNRVRTIYFKFKFSFTQSNLSSLFRQQFGTDGIKIGSYIWKFVSRSLSFSRWISRYFRHKKQVNKRK
jgi:hypothetical protein